MINEQIILYKNNKGEFVPYDTENNEKVLLTGSKEEILKKVEEAIKNYYSKEKKPTVRRFINKNTLIVKYDWKETLCNTEGKLLGNTFVSQFIDGYVEHKWDWIPYQKYGEYGFMNIKTGEIRESNWLNVRPFKEGLAVVRDRQTNKYGYINENLELVIPCEYDAVGNFSDSLAYVGILISSKKQLKDPKIALTKEDMDTINRILNIRRDVLIFGFIDKTGKMVIPFSYKYVKDFSEGHAFVKTFDDYHSGFYIDKENKKTKRIWDENPTYFKNGVAYAKEYNHEKNGDHPMLYRLRIKNGKLFKEEIDIDEYEAGTEAMKAGLFNKKEQGEYKILNKNDTDSRFIDGLYHNGEEVEIDLFGAAKNLIEEFLDNKTDDIIYEYDIRTNEIKPPREYIIGTRTTLEETEVKPYTRKRTLTNS